MVGHLKKGLIVTFLFSVISLSGQFSYAQDIGISERQGSYVSVEFFKQRFDYLKGTNFGTSVVLISTRSRIGERARFVFDLPVSNFSVSYGTSYKETIVGNPYVGAEFTFPNSTEESAVFGRLGIFLPTAENKNYNAIFSGLYTTTYKIEYFLSHFFTFLTGLSYRAVLNENESDFSLTINALYLIPDEYDLSNEFYLDYSTDIWFGNDRFRAGVGINGRFLVTGDFYDTKVATFYNLGLACNYKFGRFQPGISFILPLDDNTSDIIDYIYSLNLTYFY